MITLIIVDCQNDFITGTMSVKGAKNAVDEIKKYVKTHRDEIAKIIFTADWHPYNHCSFKKYGGEWPHHCIQYTPGACIEPKLLKYIQSFEIDYEVCQKGAVEEVEEYGAFSDIQFSSDNFGDRIYLDIVEADPSTDFVICGIAGDYCVKATIQNMLNEGVIPKVFCPGIVSIDGGKIFSNFIKENNLEKTV